MAPENKNIDFGKVESGQKRLETVATGKESPEALKQKLVQYRQTYQTEVNQQKTTLSTFKSTLKSKESKDYVELAVENLTGKMEALAGEGEKLQKKGIDAKKASGKELSEQELGFQTLSEMKAALKTELNTEAQRMNNFRLLEPIQADIIKLYKQNEAMDKAGSLAALSGNLAKKKVYQKELVALGKKLTTASTNVGSGTFEDDLLTGIKSDYKIATDEVAEDIDGAEKLLKYQTELKTKDKEVTALQNELKKKPARLTEDEYKDFISKANAKQKEVGEYYQQIRDVFKISSPMLNAIGVNGYILEAYTPVSDHLHDLHQKIEEKKPLRSGPEPEPDPEHLFSLMVSNAKAKFAEKSKEVATIKKALEDLAKDKDKSKSLDRKILDDYNKQLNTIITDIDKIYNETSVAVKGSGLAYKSKIDLAGGQMSDNPSIAAMAKEAHDVHYEPTLKYAENVLEANKSRETEIKNFEEKTLNDQLAQMLPKMDASWQENVNNKVQFLGPAPSDENSKEYQAHLDGEKTMLAYLTACESQVNFVLSKKDSGINWDNKKRFDEYQKLCGEKIKLITENRANRKMAKAAGSAQDQDHEYSVVVGTKTKIKYVRDPYDPKGRIAVEETENVYETRKDTYKFSDCVEFIQPSDPKYKEINGGKGWRFKKDDLPQSVKDRFELQAATIVTEARADAESETRKEKQKIISENKLFDKAREELGENAKDYFAALDALAQGDAAKAMGLYKQYLEKAKNFSAEDKEKHASYIADAQKQVEVYADSAEFYEGMALMKDGKLDDAIAKLRTYIEKIKAKPEADQKKFAEQLEMSVEIVRKFNSAKLAMFDELKFDLKYAHAIKVAKGLNSNADLVEQLKKIEANSAAIDAGKEPPFKGKDVELEGNARRLMLPYLPFNVLTEEEKKQRGLGRGGLQGEEIVDLESGIRKIKERIDKGEPLNFDEEIKKLGDKLKHYGDPYPGGRHFNDPETGERRLDTVTPHLFRLFSKINTTDAAAREKGFVEIADYFKENEIGMKYTQKYLSKAMVYRYEEFEKEDGGETKKEVVKKMMSDPAIAADVNRGAREYYKRWVAEQNAQMGRYETPLPVDPPDPFVLQSFQKQIFEQKMRYQYEREMRKKMTDKGWASDGSALQRFNVSLPYNDGSGRWYKPWTWSDYNEDDWVDFKKQATQFAVETIVTLPIGMGAGAIGRAVGRGMLSMLMRQGLKAEAIMLLEEGGIMALRANAAVWEGVSPALKTAIMAQRGRILAGYAVGVMAEGGAMLLMNSVWEGLQSGRQPEFFRLLDAKDWKHVSLKLVESIGKAGAFRAFGAGQQKILQGLGGAEAGALQKAGAVVLSEAFSGFAGTGLEALTLIAQGQGNQVTFDFWAKGLIQNALQSYGTHKIHGAGGGEKAPVIDKKLEARFKKAETELMADRTYERLLPEGKITVDGVVVDLTKKPFSEQPKSVQEQIIQKAKVAEVIPLPDGGFIINGQKFDPITTPVNKLPAPIREIVLQKAKEFRTEKLAENLSAAGIREPADMVAIRDGQAYNKEGKAVRIEDPSLLPDNLKARYEELRRAEVKQKARDLLELRTKISRKEELEKDPENNADELAKLKTELEAKAKEMGTTMENLATRVDQQLRVFTALDSLYSSERQLYSESKIVKKPVLKEDGTPLLGPDNQPVYQEVNLFQHYESKTSAYSADLLHGLSHEALMQAGGCKIIKIGGDEIVVYHAGENGKIQKLFIDISNMGPTNDTATTMSGSRVNLVDIFLYQISVKIKAESAAHLGKALDGAKFNKEISDVANQLFNLDRTPQGYRVPAPDGEAKFNKLKQEWNLEGDYAKYMVDMDSMRILAEYRADTRSLDASYKGKKDLTFSEHIGQEIESLTGMPLVDLQKLIASNPEQFSALIDKRRPTNDKLLAMSSKEIMGIIAKLDPKSSKPEDMMMLYSLMARIDTATMAGQPALKPLADKLNTTRVEMVGEPPHSRIEAPRIMDAKVVSIDLPPDVAAALRKLADTNPTEAHAILTAARTLAEKPLDQLKYKKTEGFAEFNILDHIEMVNGKIVIKKSAKEFREAYETNLKDKKVANIVAIEASLAKARATLEGLRSKMEKGQIDPATYEREMGKVEAEINKLEDRLTIDPDTGAYSQAYLDCKPTRIFAFPDGNVPMQYRTWNAVVTELSHAGVINSKYGYLGMDTIMKAYHDVLKAEISAQLPPNLQHFKIIRSGGGKFEVVFLDARAVSHLQQKGLTPDSLVEKIASTSGQKAVDKILSADPEAVKKSQTDAAVRNSQFKYNKGTPELEVGKLTVSKQKAITPVELALVQHDLPKASARELIAEVMKRRAQQQSQPVEKVSSDELPPNATATESLFYSAFDSQVPPGLPENSVGWIDKSGRIHYNTEYLNTKLAEGYSIAVTTKGEFRIKTPTGELLTLKGYENAMKGTPFEGVLLGEMKYIKTHESTHKVLEFAFTKSGIEDPAKTQSLLDLFATPDTQGKVPDGKIALIDSDGKPITLNWANVQDFICYISDGSVRIDPSSMQKLEQVIAEQVPGFTFSKVRTISTKLMAEHPSDAFTRYEEAASVGKEPWWKDQTYKPKSDQEPTPPAKPKSSLPEWMRKIPQPAKPNVQPIEQAQGLPAWAKAANAAKPKPAATVEAPKPAKPVELPPGVPPEAAAFYQATLDKVLSDNKYPTSTTRENKYTVGKTEDQMVQIEKDVYHKALEPYRQEKDPSPEKCDYLPGNVGHKLHLNVEPENVVAVSNYLKAQGYMHKYLSGGELSLGKIFTIYIGSYDKATHWAKKISEDLSPYLVRPRSGEVEYAPNVTGRFDALTQGFARKDVGLGAFNPLSSVATLLSPWSPNRNKPETRKMVYDISFVELAKRYGEYFYGSGKEAPYRSDSPPPGVDLPPGAKITNVTATPGEKPAIPLDAEPNALSSGHQSKFVTELPPDVIAEGKAPQDVPAFINKQGEIHYNSAYFEKRFNVKLAQVNGKNVFIHEGKALSPKQFFKTETGRKVLEAMKAIKTHEVVHRQIELIDSKSSGELNKALQDSISKDAELTKLFTDAGYKTFDKRSIQEFLAEIADGTIKINDAKKVQLEQTITKFLREQYLKDHPEAKDYPPTFTFARARQLDTKLLAQYKQIDFAREFTDTKYSRIPIMFNLVDAAGNALLNWRVGQYNQDGSITVVGPLDVNTGQFPSHTFSSSAELYNNIENAALRHPKLAIPEVFELNFSPGQQYFSCTLYGIDAGGAITVLAYSKADGKPQYLRFNNSADLLKSISYREVAEFQGITRGTQIKVPGQTYDGYYVHRVLENGDLVMGQYPPDSPQAAQSALRQVNVAEVKEKTRLAEERQMRIDQAALELGFGLDMHSNKIVEGKYAGYEITDVNNGKIVLRLGKNMTEVHDILDLKIADMPKPPRNNIAREAADVPRTVEVLAVGDLHGNQEILIANLKSLRVINENANFTDINSIHWTGGARRVVFHGDILADRGTNSLDIMATIRKLQGEAKAAGGEVTLIAGNHEDFALSFLTGKKIAGADSDGFLTSMLSNQGAGLVEFIQRYSTDPRLQGVKSLKDVVTIFGVETLSLPNGSEVPRPGPAYDNMLAYLRKDILANMRKSKDGKELLVQMAGMKVGEYIDDTLFLHTDPTPEILALIESYGTDVGTAIDKLNAEFQTGLRFHLLGEGAEPANYEKIKNAFTDTGNRTSSGPDPYSTMDFSKLKAKGVNRVIHGHSSDAASMVHKRNGVEITSVDFDAGKKGRNMEDRSIGKIAVDGKLSTGTDVNADVAATHGLMTVGRVDGKMPDQYYLPAYENAREKVYLDKANDPVVKAMIDEIRKVRLLPENQKAQKLFDMVVAATNHPTAFANAAKLSGFPKLGEILQSQSAGPRHRSLLAKVLGEEAGLKVSIVRGSLNGYQHSWNEIRFDNGQTIVVDFSKITANNTPTYFPVGALNKVYYRDLAGNPLYTQPGVVATGTI